MSAPTTDLETQIGVKRFSPQEVGRGRSGSLGVDLACPLKGRETESDLEYI